MNDRCPRIMLAAPASGAGKTTFAIGLLAALAGRGLRVAACKCGPDYIDPMFHREVLGLPGVNLDLFFTPPEITRGLFHRLAVDADLSVMEGAMGFYDGVADTTEASSWHLAVETATPTLLIIRPAGAFLSVAAMVKGFRTFRGDGMIRGLALNQCGEGLFRKLKPMLEKETGLPVFGYLPDLPATRLESRHLGLATPDSVKNLRSLIAVLAAQMERTLDIDGLLELATSAPALSGSLPSIEPAGPKRARLAVAQDRAFCFYYRENLEMLEALGLDLVPFSPISDPCLPERIGGIYLGGGYPELHLKALAENNSLRESIKASISSGLPTLAECGGFLYLQQRLLDKDGGAYPMVGALPGTGSFSGRLGRFGYAEFTARRDTPFCRAGETIRGHEFHYWDSDRPGDAFDAAKPHGRGAWICIESGPALFAGFPHIYFWSNPFFARRFAEAVMNRSLP